MADRNYTEEEKKAGQKAARTIQRNFRAILATATVKQTGRMLSSARATATMRFDALEAITISASPATFIQHYGFEGIKKNGIAMRMIDYNHFGVLFDKSKSTLEKLTAEVAEIRGEEIMTKIQDVIKYEYNTISNIG